MSFGEWFLRLLSNVGFVIRRGHTQGRPVTIATYLKIELKRFFLVRLFGRNLTTESIFGFRVHFYSYETFAILFEEVFLPDVYFFLATSPQPFVLDCGSNIGLAVLYFKSLYPNCKIVAFEPDEATFSLLKRNVEVNNLTDVTLINKALYDSKRTIEFYISPDQPGLLVQSIRKESLSASQAKTVETEMLSNYVDQEVDFLKMDIEGAEDHVMRDLEQSAKLPLIKEMVIEYHHHMTPREDYLGLFLQRMESSNFGYQIRAPLPPPFKKGEFQGLLVYGYRLAE